MRDATEHLERRPAREPGDSTWARARFARVRAIWAHAAASYGPDWAQRLHVMFSEGVEHPLLAHPEDGVELEALRAWVATQRGDARG